MFRRKLLLFGAVFVSGLTISGRLADATVYWSTVASGCLPGSKAVQKNLYLNPEDYSVGMAPGVTAPSVLVCPVGAKTAPLMPDVLGLTYKDSTASSTAATVRATLVKVNKATGARSSLATIASDDGSDTGPALAKTAPFAEVLDFAQNYYYVRVDIDRAARSQDVRAIGVSLESSCGNGLITGSEACDDANTVDGDGCTAQCAEELGYDCTGEPSVCSPICGDGFIAPPEACDDGDVTPGDGCSASCQEEPGFDCSGQPSICMPTAICGNGVIEATEGCDDNDATGGDGCSSSCQVELGFICVGQPSICVLD